MLKSLKKLKVRDPNLTPFHGKIFSPAERVKMNDFLRANPGTAAYITVSKYLAHMDA